jgi:hypothetical protein
MSVNQSLEAEAGGEKRREFSTPSEPRLITQSDPTQEDREAIKQMRVGEESMEVQEILPHSTRERELQHRETTDYQEEKQELLNKKSAAKLGHSRTKKVTFGVNPYVPGEAFKVEREKAEARKVDNSRENKDSVYYGVKFSIHGAHKEGENYTNDVGTLRCILKAILAKAQTIDKSAYISPWIDELPPVKTEEDLSLIRKDSVYEYLYTPRIKKGSVFVRKDVKRGYNQAYSIRIQSNSVNKEGEKEEAEFFATRWNRDAEGVVNFYLHKEMVNGNMIEVSVRDLTLRPIQGRCMKEIGYIHGSVRGMQMDDILEHFQKAIYQQFQTKIGCAWSQPEIGTHAIKMWQRANKYEGKERIGWAPLIQVIYAEEENHSKLQKMAMALHKAYGQYEEIKIKSKSGTEYSEYVMNALPGGSRGIFFPAFDVQRTNEGKKGVLDLLEMHIQLKQENSSWILTDLVDPDMFFEHEGKLLTIREYLLGIQVTDAVFLFHNMTTYVNPYMPEEAKVYLICNNQYKQGAAQKYREKMDWLVATYPELKDAMHDDISIGEISAFTLSTRNPNVPTKEASAYEVNLTATIKRERDRLSNVVIEGRRIKEDRAGMEFPIFARKPARIMRFNRQSYPHNYYLQHYWSNDQM